MATRYLMGQVLHLVIETAVSEEEKQRIWDTFHKPRLNRQVDYHEVIHDYFNKIVMYHERVFPQLSETIRAYETFNDRLKIKFVTVNALKGVAFIFVFGVVFQILISWINQDVGLEWHALLPYFLMLITVVPHAYIWAKLFRKIKILDYR